MADFTKYYPEPSENPRALTGLDFVGWDHIKQGEEATEASRSAYVGQPMSATDVARFESLKHGQREIFQGVIYTHYGP